MAREGMAREGVDLLKNNQIFIFFKSNSIQFSPFPHSYSQFTTQGVVLLFFNFLLIFSQFFLFFFSPHVNIFFSSIYSIPRVDFGTYSSSIFLECFFNDLSVLNLWEQEGYLFKQKVLSMSFLYMK